ETVVADDELALAAGAVLDRDLRAKPLRQLALELRGVRILPAARPSFLGAAGLCCRRGEAAHQRFRLAHGQALACDQRRDFGLLAALAEAEQRSRMAHLERALLHQ